MGGPIAAAMRRLHPRFFRRLPSVWLMTDSRNRADRLPVLARLPRGAGVVFRDGDLPREERRVLFHRVAAMCARRSLVLFVAGRPIRGDWRAHGRHNSRRRDRPLSSRPVHDARQATRARHLRTDVRFVSPVGATRSHPDARGLGRWGFARLARRCGAGWTIALGGLTAERARPLRALGADGWAAIDGLSGPWSDQNLKAVPTYTAELSAPPCTSGSSRSRLTR